LAVAWLDQQRACATQMGAMELCIQLFGELHGMLMASAEATRHARALFQQHMDMLLHAARATALCRDRDLVVKYLRAWTDDASLEQALDIVHKCANVFAQTLTVTTTDAPAHAPVPITNIIAVLAGCRRAFAQHAFNLQTRDTVIANILEHHPDQILEILNTRARTDLNRASREDVAWEIPRGDANATHLSCMFCKRLLSCRFIASIRGSRVIGNLGFMACAVCNVQYAGTILKMAVDERDLPFKFVQKVRQAVRPIDASFVHDLADELLREFDTDV
jgi:hypothetical protein